MWWPGRQLFRISHQLLINNLYIRLMYNMKAILAFFYFLGQIIDYPNYLDAF